MIQILILVILIFCNAFFAATEIAFISLNDIKLEKDVKDGNKKAKLVQDMIKNPSKFLATIQIGITLAGFLSSAFASDAFADNLAPILRDSFPILSLDAWYKISIVFITIILSYFTLVFGELVPKRIAMKHSEKLAYFSIKIIRFIYIISAPFVKLLTISTEIISKIFGVDTSEEESVTEEEIRMMVDVGQEKGAIRKEEREMIQNVFEFNDKLVSDVMVKNSDVVFLNLNDTIENAIDKIKKNNNFSRIPVYRKSKDKVEGIVYVKDIITNMDKIDFKLESVMRKPLYIQSTLYINDAFKLLSKNKRQIAVVVDENKNSIGIITMEDILEELVGEIYDEYDKV